MKQLDIVDYAKEKQLFCYEGDLMANILLTGFWYELCYEL